ncbi:MAG TPA: lipoate--protein ligase family protein, partial [Candidatus Binatia bacterium]|nr:lipoate--protein ligase family protein [Candidatus Binatia bacterium]
MTRTWRLLVTEPTDGATNMAVDEALWRGRQAGTSPPTLRFFAWAPPTVSLGYGQPLDGSVDAAACRRLGVGLVRRPTGGSAIYHDGPERELTYSVTATADDIGGISDLLGTYRWIALALRHGLCALGAAAEVVAVPETEGPAPAFCFARTGRWEIEVSGRKLVGSAQRRQGACFLQHGSVLLGVDAPRLRVLFPTTPD